MNRLALVGCSGSKYPPEKWGKAHPEYQEGDDVEQLPLEHLYRGPYWTVKRRYGRTVPDDWRILSAGLGLADPQRKMESSYDQTIKKMSEEAIRGWVADLEPELRSFLNPPGEAVIVDVLLGQAYLSPIERILEDCDVTIAYPFAGTSGNGEQMSRLNQFVDEYREHGAVQDPQMNAERLLNRRNTND